MREPRLRCARDPHTAAVPATSLDSDAGRATPSRRAAEVRRKAADLFEQSGYAATTITDIANAAGVLPGSLYHHFDSKEDIAVAILAELDTDLRRVVRSASEAFAGMTTPEERVRHLATEVTTLSMRHGAAVRLHSYEAPSVATERLRTALRAPSPGLGRAWSKATAGLLPHEHERAADVGLLRHALQQLTLTAAINLGDVPPDPSSAARQICDLLLAGVATDCPPDEELDASEPLAAARDELARWPAPQVSSGSGSREDIAAAARAEFARRGYDATTVRDVAEAAQVRMGTLYRRFGSKEELLEEIIGTYGTRLDAALRAAMTTGTSAPETLDAMAFVLVTATRRFREESEIVKVSGRARETSGGPIGTYLDQAQERVRLLDQILERGIAQGSLRPLAAPDELGRRLNAVFWLSFGDYARTGPARAHQFLRSSVLRGLTTR